MAGAEIEESFEAFMRRALFDPRAGYYSRRIGQVGGHRADFATSATLSPSLGRSIAVWLKEEGPEVMDVIEVGAGSGELMATVQRELGWWRRRRLRFHLVETSAPLRQVQQERLGSTVHWHDTLESALQEADGKAWIYHNELLDAFPCRRLQWTEQGWHEVGVKLREGRVVAETLDALHWRPHEQECFSAARQWTLESPPPHPSQRVELHGSVRQWMQGWAPAWKAGAMLTVDYGDDFPALYHRRPQGSLRGYLMHQRVEGDALYQNVGRQDLTADINFSDYQSWAEELGWSLQWRGCQGDWLQRWGEGGSPLADPAGAGGAFQCLLHRAAAAKA